MHNAVYYISKSYTCKGIALFANKSKGGQFIMGLFGPRKKELKKEIERLQGLLLPEQQQIDVLNEQIRQLNDRKNSLENGYGT